MTPRRTYRTLALAEAVTWTLLLAGMVLKYVLDVTELGVRIGGGLHGFVFLAYCVATVLVGVDARWSVGRIGLGLAAAFVPYATVPFERRVDGTLAQRWRLRAEPGRGPLERVAAAALRAPVLAGVVVLVGLVVVFGGLLAAGPPTQWVG
ncbi:hypothetical protein ASG49_07680 [Marmoricola sp. Leaf446]|uniref:DUF3817 domain-containing protein n=1 Tax=Marmoricola sp. Leaf446 TaxID=1736379 RepID=UPI0006F92660|nr:DUF3817 domain-containing protein [Marmoricola sp. Leaf446]KQT94696.1 hypothetical protein ASG49_07680 [Marmoricola sp. Leaf446]